MGLIATKNASFKKLHLISNFNCLTLSLHISCSSVSAKIVINVAYLDVKQLDMGCYKNGTRRRSKISYNFSYAEIITVIIVNAPVTNAVIIEMAYKKKIAAKRQNVQPFHLNPIHQNKSSCAKFSSHAID